VFSAADLQRSLITVNDVAGHAVCPLDPSRRVGGEDPSDKLIYSSARDSSFSAVI